MLAEPGDLLLQTGCKMQFSWSAFRPQALRKQCSGVKDAAHLSQALTLLISVKPMLTAASTIALQRQRLMVQQFYTEVGALEEVLEEAAYALGDEAYSVLNQVSKYIDQVGQACC